MNSLVKSGAVRLWTVLPSLALICLAGCDDPIYDSVQLEVTKPARVLPSKSDLSDYDWPLNRTTYSVSRPSPMSYVTSFSQPLSRPDPVGAELVPWSEDGLDDRAKQFLRYAYQPHSERPDVVFSLNQDQCVGPQAFDVNSDGTRLVVIESEGLALYDTEDGSLIGRFPFPGEMKASNSAVSAVRFCGNSSDLLVASPEQIFRIDGKDKSVASAKGPGEPIAQWMVTDSDAMIMLGESGRLYGGDTGLEFLTAYDTGKDVFDSVSLSPDGTRIGVCFNGDARVYLQDNFQITDQVDYDQERTSSKVGVALGLTSEVWADGEGVFCTLRANNGPRTSMNYPMIWRPLTLSNCTLDSGGSFYLTIGHRFAGGREQLVLFDYGAVGRRNSMPIILEELPKRIAHDQMAMRVAMMDSNGLHVIHREFFRSRDPYLASWIRDWVNEDKIDVIEKVLAVIQTQTRMGFGQSSESLRSLVIDAIADLWRVSEAQSDSKEFARLEQWRKSESQLALIASAVRHYKRAWKERGGGTAGTVSRDGWQVYNERLKMAKSELVKGIEMGDPPLAAFDHHVQIGLEQGEDFVEFDAICRQASQAYPGEVEPHGAIAFMLLPRWHGRRGDTLSFVRSASRMHEGREGDLLYVRLICRLARKISIDDKIAWKSYDLNRARRGFDEYVRRGVAEDDLLWTLWADLHLRATNRKLEDDVMTHLMEHAAAFPSSFTDVANSYDGIPTYETMPFYAAMKRLRNSPQEGDKD